DAGHHRHPPVRQPLPDGRDPGARGGPRAVRGRGPRPSGPRAAPGAAGGNPAQSKGRPVGTMGAVGCFSSQQGKHITSGEGGFVVTNDAALARRMRVFVNKAWPYGEPNPDHEFLALNYRITELQSAVLFASVRKLDANVKARITAADRLAEQFDGLAGVGTPVVAPDDVHCYWRFCLRIDPELVPGGPGAVAQALKFYDIAAAPRYI